MSADSKGFSFVLGPKKKMSRAAVEAGNAGISGFRRDFVKTVKKGVRPPD